MAAGPLYWRDRAKTPGPTPQKYQQPAFARKSEVSDLHAWSRTHDGGRRRSTEAMRKIDHLNDAPKIWLITEMQLAEIDVSGFRTEERQMVLLLSLYF